MKKLSCLLLIVTFVLSAHAQTITLVAGFQAPHITPDYIKYPDTLPKVSSQPPGIVLGLTTDIDLSKKLFLQTGLLYHTFSSNWTQFYDTTNLYPRTMNLPDEKKLQLLSVNTALRMKYIDVPVNLVLKLPLNGNNRFIVGGGPVASFFFNGSTSQFTLLVAQDNDSDTSIHFSSRIHENNDLPIGKAPGKYRVCHWAANAMVGFEFNRIALTFNYRRDLNEYFEEEGRNYRMGAWGFRLGIYLANNHKM